MNSKQSENGDSERLQEFVCMTTLEVKAISAVSPATALEMIEYIRELESQLAEAKQLLSVSDSQII